MFDVSLNILNTSNIHAVKAQAATMLADTIESTAEQICPSEAGSQL